jgi:hypothetical protein
MQTEYSNIVSAPTAEAQNPSNPWPFGLIAIEEIFENQISIRIPAGAAGNFDVANTVTVEASLTNDFAVVVSTGVSDESGTVTAENESFLFTTLFGLQPATNYFFRAYADV